MQWMNPGAYAMPGASTAGYANPAGGMNWFDPNAWTGMMMPQQAPAQQEAPAQQ